MPQFIKEITSVSHSPLCHFQINWWAPRKDRQAVATSWKQSFFVSPEKQHVMQKVHTDVCWSRRIQWKVWCSGEGLKNAGGGFLFLLFFFSTKVSAFLFFFSKSMGLTQSYKKGRLIHKVAGAVKPEESQQWICCIESGEQSRNQFLTSLKDLRWNSASCLLFITLGQDRSPAGREERR